MLNKPLRVCKSKRFDCRQEPNDVFRWPMNWSVLTMKAHADASRAFSWVEPFSPYKEEKNEKKKNKYSK